MVDRRIGRIVLALSIAGLLTISLGYLGRAAGQTVVQDDDCTFSVAASAEGKNWWVLSAACEFSGWDFIDVQGFGLRGSDPISSPPECQKYGDQTFSSGSRLQSHVCGPAGLEPHPEAEDNLLSGAANVKVNPKAFVDQGFSARTLAVKLYYTTHPSLHGAGGLAAEVEIKVPEKWVKPDPSPSPTETLEPSPSPSESVPTASPSPTPGPLLQLTKTVSPSKLAEKGPPQGATWTVTVRNVGTAAYEGKLEIRDTLPDIWNLVPIDVSVTGAMGFAAVPKIYSFESPLTVQAGAKKGAPGKAWTFAFKDAAGCSIEIGAGKTLKPTFEGNKTTVDHLGGSNIYAFYLADVLRGPAEVYCSSEGRIEPGEEVVLTISSLRSDRDDHGDVKHNWVTASWSGGSDTTHAVVELEGLRSVIDDIDGVIGLGRETGRGTKAGPGLGLLGTESDDELIGSARSDVLLGHYGNDVLRGRAGRDILSGDTDDDELFGGPDRDGLLGGSGRDRIEGEGGNDFIVGGPHKDRLFGGAGNDRIEARDGARDVVDCGGGKDIAIVDKKDVVRNCERVRRK